MEAPRDILSMRMSGSTSRTLFLHVGTGVANPAASYRLVHAQNAWLWRAIWSRIRVMIIEVREHEGCIRPSRVAGLIFGEEFVCLA